MQFWKFILAYCSEHPGAVSEQWKIVDEYLAAYDSMATSYKYATAVVDKAISVDALIALPNFLFSNLKKCNPGALLLIFMRHGLLQASEALTKEYLAAKLNTASTAFLPKAHISFSLLEMVIARATDHATMKLQLQEYAAK